MAPNLIFSNEKLIWKGKELPCSWGLNGLSDNKVEGDKTTPIGTFPFRRVFFRPDRGLSVQTPLPLTPLTPQDGWCDDPNDPHYNQHIRKPYPGRHEDLWREDHVYDIILVVGHNDDPVIKGKGSAVFVHIRRPEGTGTQGCIALHQEDLLRVLKECTMQSALIVKP